MSSRKFLPPTTKYAGTELQRKAGTVRGGGGPIHSPPSTRFQAAAAQCALPAPAKAGRAVAPPPTRFQPGAIHQASSRPAVVTPKMTSVTGHGHTVLQRVTLATDDLDDGPELPSISEFFPDVRVTCVNNYGAMGRDGDFLNGATMRAEGRINVLLPDIIRFGFVQIVTASRRERVYEDEAGSVSVVREFKAVLDGDESDNPGHGFYSGNGVRNTLEAAQVTDEPSFFVDKTYRLKSRTLRRKSARMRDEFLLAFVVMKASGLIKMWEKTWGYDVSVDFNTNAVTSISIDGPGTHLLIPQPMTIPGGKLATRYDDRDDVVKEL